MIKYGATMMSVFVITLSVSAAHAANVGINLGINLGNIPVTGMMAR